MKIEDFNRANNLLHHKEKLLGEIGDLDAILERAKRPYASSKVSIYLDASIYNPSRFSIDCSVFKELIENEIKKKKVKVFEIDEKFKKLGE